MTIEIAGDGPATLVAILIAARLVLGDRWLAKRIADDGSSAHNVHRSVLAIQWEADSMNVSIAQVRNNLADALNRVAYGGERVVLERRGKPVAALVSMEDLALLEQIENEADLKAARKARQEKGSVTLEEIKARLGMK